MQAEISANAQVASPSWRRFGAIVLFYAALGPFFGAIGVTAVFTAMAISVEVWHGNFGRIGQMLLAGMVIGTIVSVIAAYVLGIFSATCVGFAVAIRDRRRGGISWWAALISALLLWLLTAMLAFSAVPPEGSLQWIGALFVAHLLAATICTWIARRIFR